jgi:cobalt-zinc-cadmium resistance protein CzcA
MLNRVIEFSIKNKLVVAIFVFALIGYGSYQYTKLPIDAVPDITNNQVQVITVAPALGATDIERLVTFPVELANSNISGLKEIRSFSRFGLSLVTIVFNDGIDIYWARQQVAERLQQVQSEIPQGIAPPYLGPVTTGLGEIYQYVVKPKKGYENKFSPMQLRTIQDWFVRRQLLGVKGIADVSSFGGELKQYEIAIDQNRLKAQQLNIQDVFDALEKNNQNTGGAYIEKGPTVLYIRSEGLLGSIQDIESINIKSLPNGTPVRISDVAKVGIGKATRYGAICYNTEGEVAGAVVMMLKGENSSDVIKNVKTKVAEIQKTLPEGVEIEPFLDRTKMVNNAISTVQTNLLEGALIVLFVLILFLGNLRAGLLVASVIPLAMLFAISLMNYFGVIGNLMSLGALDFGLIVDGAVFIVEAAIHQMHHSKHFAHEHTLTQHHANEETIKSSSKIARSVVFGQVIILIVYIPIFVLEGIEGKMFIPMAQTVVFALLGAFILSITYVPMMSSLIVSKTKPTHLNFSDKMMLFFERRFEPMLEKVLHFPKVLIAGTLAVFVLSMVLLAGMGGEFIPTLEEGDFAVETRLLTGSNLNTTIDYTQKASQILLKKFPEVEKVVTKIGSGEIPTDPMPMEAADMMIILKDKHEWTSAKTFAELSEKMTAALSDIPGIRVSFQFPVQMRFNELMTGAKQDVVCKIFGENMDTLAKYAQIMGDISSTVKGTENIYVEAVGGMPQIIINYNRATIAQFGLAIEDVNRVVNAALAGQSAGFVYEGEKRFDLVVRLDKTQKSSLQDIRNLLIPTPQGSQIPLSQLADVNITDGPNQIQRESTRRRIMVGFNVRNRDVQSVVEELQKNIDKKVKLPAGYSIVYGGSFENLNAAKARLKVTVPIALLLIFLLLYFSFNSIKQGLLIYSAIPLSAMGGIFALVLRGMPFSISAGVGFIALFGVAVLNGIVLISEFNRLRSEGMRSAKEIVMRGTKLKLRPVLMTGFVASLGFLPMAISNGSGAEVQRPLATVVIGGLLLATFLTLFMLPVLYVLIEEGFTGKKQRVVTTAIVLFLLFFSIDGYAQTNLRLADALRLAETNNIDLKNEQLNAEYFKLQKRTAVNIPQTTVSSEFGQINSAYYDTKFGISQGLDFPLVYVRQKQYATEEYKKSLFQVKLKEQELNREVRFVFYELVYLQQKLKLLQASDSGFVAFAQKAGFRFKAGESNVVEKAAAENQHIQIAVQRLALENDMLTVQAKLNALLHTNQQYQAVWEDNAISMPSITDTTLLSNHSALLVLNQQQLMQQKLVQLEKSKLFPELFLGYANTSIRGTGADNVTYNSAFRFHTGQIGIGIPLFFGAQSARIKSAKILTNIAENNLQQKRWQLQLDYARLMAQFNTSKEQLNYFEQTALRNAETIAGSATKQFVNGEINYLEWVMLTNQTIAIRSQYLDAQKSYYETIIQLNYLLQL